MSKTALVLGVAGMGLALAMFLDNSLSDANANSEKTSKQVMVLGSGVYRIVKST